MPVFSSNFERSEIQVVSSTPALMQSNLMISNTSIYNHIKSEGVPVVSLSFNPYNCDTELKKQTYLKATNEIAEKKEKLKILDSEQKEKVMQLAIQKEWAVIAKKEVPKMWKAFQKNKSDAEQNCKKIVRNAIKDARKKLSKTYRGGKESQVRAKRLQREMLNYWKRKDKEIQEMKKKLDKAEKEIKKKQDEEREALLQKKKLEFIMRKSEIYTHFMAKKLGVADSREQALKGEVEIDEKEAEKAVMDMIKNREREKKNFNIPEKVVNKEDEVRLDTVDISSSTVVKAPTLFKGELKEYQIKGLRWLDSLYQQGINGILADEMGLGKTIQAISLLAHVSENKNDWGPFCIVAPSTTLHNWKNELEKFTPHFRVLPYWGTFSERKMLRKFFNPKHLSMPYSPFHVVITSYQLIALDEKYFRRPKWHYMILDEAQAIKNFNSQRWGVLLSFESRNRLLLTGTPIQNSMAELWALLHFIMPDLFDSHDQFQEWFSKDIEAHCQNEGELNKRHLERLHKVLKPFMLRRVKKDVENELGPKKEYTEFCDMTYRQKILYKELKSIVKSKNITKNLQTKNKLENLMNLVMQLRKVCNHPELLKPKETQSSYYFTDAVDYQRESVPVVLSGSNTTIPVIYKEIFSCNCNPVKLILPKLIFDECYYLWTQPAKQISNVWRYKISTVNKQKLLNIYSAERINSVTYGNEEICQFNCVQSRSFVKNAYSTLLLFGLSASNIEYISKADPIMSAICILHYIAKKYNRNKYVHCNSEKQKEFEIKYESMLNNKVDLCLYNSRISILESFTNYRVVKCKDQKSNDINNGSDDMAVDNENEDQFGLVKSSQLEILNPIVLPNLFSCKVAITRLSAKLEFYLSKVSSWPIEVICSSYSFRNNYKAINNNYVSRQLVTGCNSFKPSIEAYPGKMINDSSSMLPFDFKNLDISQYNTESYGGSIELMHFGSNGYSEIQVPAFKRLINDCGKMSILDKLLKNLYFEKHRCLIFCQMTKMMDIIEEYLSWKQYTYFRMDGSTQINDRRDMVDEFQRNDNIFCFLLSTRAGGLGVTLTGADTVIFYDNDWNPTMDAQATDRAHRIGQTKEVSVYRLITKHTVEENILKRAKQKETVQSTVYSGGALRADTLKPSELVDFLVNEDHYEPNEPASFIKTKKRGKKGAVKGEEDDEEIKAEESPTLKKSNTGESHKIQYHYVNKGERSYSINQEAEEKAKEALKLMKIQNLHNDAEDDGIVVNEDLQDLLDANQDEVEVCNIFDDKEDQIQIDKDE